ncbi:MAG: PspC domain-containing protein [Acidimicrobiales bacterium]|nr:PspC domain-containing protein [Acidimicrobiales bacterium]
MNRRDQVLYRDTEDQKIRGVCGGLGHYFDIDTDLVRVAFVALTLVGGGGLIAYILLALILDPAPPGYYDAEDQAEAEIDLGTASPLASPPPPARDVAQPQDLSQKAP